MNGYAIIILVCLLLHYGVSTAADWLNLRLPRDRVPPEMAGLLDEGWLHRATAYLRASTRLGFWEELFDLLLLLGFWFCGGFNYVDTGVRALGFGPVVTGVLYMGVLVLANLLLSLPFAIYATFVIEERFGFNRTTPRLFVLDRLKGLMLAVVLGVPLLAAVLAFFEHAGPWAWVWCWLVVVAFSLFVQFLAPVLILPLFNKFVPLEDGELKSAITDMAQRAAFPLRGIVVMDGSKRSSKANAFFVGFGRFKRIALYDTLLRDHSVAELVAVLAHEIGHFKMRHILQRLGLGILHTGVMLFLLSVFLTHRGLFDAFHMQHTSVYAGMIFFGILYTPVELLLSLVVNSISRRQEYAADRFARDLTGSGEPLVTALRKLSINSLNDLSPHPFYVCLHYSHPPILERIRALAGPQMPAEAGPQITQIHTDKAP